jgi:hypothetical protein
VSSIQGDSGGKVNILGGDSRLSVIVRKKVHMNMCLILVTAIELFKSV